MPTLVGITALQGDFESHARAIEAHGLKCRLVKTAEALEDVDAIVLPGGESTTFLKLASENFLESLKKKILSGSPTLATCAGLIILASKVTSPSQQSLEVLDVDVIRNGYGRQVDSFIDQSVSWTDDACKTYQLSSDEGFEAVFIRAPRISRVGSKVDVLARVSGEPVLVKQGTIVAASFHPELSENHPVHHFFLNLLKDKLKQAA